jgi:predicted dehydrogenase
MRRVRWGIVGCGSIASSAIAPAVRWSSNGELLAVASRSKERAAERAAAVGAPRAYGTYEALLDDPDVDVVYLGLPNGEHARWAIAAANAGKHVLCDKSLTLSIEDALAMREAARSRGVVLVEGFMVRHHPQWTLLRSLLDEGAIGAVRHVRASFRASLPSRDDHRWSKELGGGALFDVTCYAVNAARFVTGEEPARVMGTATWAASGVDVSTDALLELPSGAVASVHGSLAAPFEQSLVVAGDRGRIVLDRPFVPHWDPVDVVVERDGARDVRRVSGANHFLHMVEHVAACAREPAGRTSPAEDGVANVAACVAILEACSRGSRADVPRVR